MPGIWGGSCPRPFAHPLLGNRSSGGEREAGAGGAGIYYLATEIYPNRYSETNKGVWQVKVFYADRADGDFLPVAGNPVQDGEGACLFQHVFDKTYYGYQCRLDDATDIWNMEVLVVPLTDQTPERKKPE